jgi:DNA-binding transcriptional MerR regulator
MAQKALVIPEKIYFKIGEVCEIVGVQPHVLRYWETEFSMLSPQKNRSGQRSYRRRDVEIALRIKELLYDDLYTIAGARKKLQSEVREASRLKIVHPEPRHEEPQVLEDEPSLFDDNSDIGDIGDIDEPSDDYHPHAEFHSEGVNPDQRQALKALASELLELRELLARGTGRREDGQS